MGSKAAEDKQTVTEAVIPYKFPVLKQLVDFLETRAFMDEGIFRISSNTDLINQYYPILASRKYCHVLHLQFI